jgi:exonuclease III
MGNSLQDYRCKIGTFMNNRSGVKIKQYMQHYVKRKSNSFKFSPVFLLMFSVLCILTYPSNLNYASQSSHLNIPNWSGNFLQSSVQIVNTNFESRYKYGNRQKNGLKIMHWNAGGKHLVNKISHIESVINGYNPHILGISEANFLKKHDSQDVQIENYKLYFSNTLGNDRIEASRVVVYVHNDVVCKVRQDLMNDKFSSIWLEINIPRQKKFLVCQAYRDWQYLNQGNKESKSIEAQLARWVEFLDQWETALQTDLECIVVGDLNIDHTKWTNQYLEQNSITKQLKPLINALFDRILPHGMVQCTHGPTRFESNSNSSGLDHFWTSNPNKLSDVHSYFHGSSDHKLISGTRYTKSIVRNPRYVKKRSYKNFSPSLFIQAVRETS